MFPYVDPYKIYSPFRRIYNSVKNRKKVCNISIYDLREQWEKQKGICPYTGWRLTLPEKSSSKLRKAPDRASLDRIDSSKGYTKDNIQFVSLMAQYAKHDWNEVEVIKFFKSVSN